MSIQDVVVYKREEIGKGPTGRLRREGKVPCVVYGLGQGSVSVSADPKAVNAVLKSEKGFNTVLNLGLDGSDETRHVMIKEVVRHPLTNVITHVDFLRIDMDKKVTITIPVELDGTPEGVKLGGVMTVIRHELEVECLPKDIPASIKADVSGLGFDQVLRIGDLPEIEGVTFTLGERRNVAVVRPPDAAGDIADDDDDDAEEAAA